jgi:hypothetical protein
MYLFIVYFDETASYEVCLGCIVLCDGYYLTEGPRDYSTHLLTFWNSHHGEGFTATCLAISKYGPIVSVQDAFDEGEGALLVDETLGIVRGEDAIERKRLWLFLTFFFEETNLLILAIDLHDTIAT